MSAQVVRTRACAELFAFAESLSMLKMLFGLMLSVALALPMSLSDRLARLEQQVKVRELEQGVAELAPRPYRNMLEKFCHIKYWDAVEKTWYSRMSENYFTKGTAKFRKKDMEIKESILKGTVAVFRNCYKASVYQDKINEPCENNRSGGSYGCKVISHKNEFMSATFGRG